MEPDVRQDTNRLGFCFTHYQQLMMQNNRLSLGLMLNSHLEELRGNIFEKKGLFAPKDAKAKKAGAIGDTCFVCSKVQWGIDHMLETVFTMFARTENSRICSSRRSASVCLTTTILYR